MEIETQTSDALQHLGRLIGSMPVGMLTTLGEHGEPHSRPMATLSMDAEPALWFLTSASSAKIAEMDHTAQVALSYSDGSHDFVSVSGTAQWVRDRAKILELWTPLARVWFPQGVDDPDLTALKVQIHRAEYWDGPDNPLVRLFTLSQAVLTGKLEERPEQHQSLKVASKS